MRCLVYFGSWWDKEGDEDRSKRGGYYVLIITGIKRPKIPTKLFTDFLYGPYVLLEVFTL